MSNEPFNNQFDVEYLGMVPGEDEGIGVGILTLRATNGTFTQLSFAISRLGLERMQKDIGEVLRCGEALNNPETLQKARDDWAVADIE